MCVSVVVMVDWLFICAVCYLLNKFVFILIAGREQKTNELTPAGQCAVHSEANMPTVQQEFG